MKCLALLSRGVQLSLCLLRPFNMQILHGLLSDTTVLHVDRLGCAV